MTLTGRILALVISTVLTLYLMELSIILVTAPRSGVSTENQAPRAVDRRNKLQVVMDYRREAVDAVPTITPHMLIDRGFDNSHDILPLAGVANRFTVLCNESGQYVSYQSDERGFRNPPESWNWDRLSVAAVGDSQTHGYCVSLEQSYVGQIRERYPRTLNLGIAGNGPLLQLATIREYLPPFRPSVVLWFFSETNDIRDTLWERENTILMRYLEPGFSQELTHKQAQINSLLSSEIEALIAAGHPPQTVSRSPATAFLRLSHLRKFIGKGKRIVDRKIGDFELYTKAVETARGIVHAWGGELILVYLPMSANYNERWWKFWLPQETIRKEVFEIANALEIPVIDIHPVFLKQKDPRSIYAVGHYDKEGNRLVAEAVLAELLGRIDSRERLVRKL